MLRQMLNFVKAIVRAVDKPLNACISSLDYSLTVHYCACSLQTLYFYLGSDSRSKANAALSLLTAIAKHSTQAARDLVQAFDFTLSALPKLCRLPRQVPWH